MREELSLPAGRILTVAVTQWCVTGQLESNLRIAVSMIQGAAMQHVDLVTLPENCLCLGSNSEMRAGALSLDSPAIAQLRNAARESKCVVVLGGFKRIDESGRVYNTALVIGNDGTILGGYDKIHLFDARVGAQSFEASSVESRGDTPVILSIRGIKIGLTICYDVRFPELYRQLALAGAEVILVPAAFTYTTGRAHWEVLLRARAIENGAFVVAPATIRSEEGGGGFQTYGHAMVVDPWGEVLMDLKEAQREYRVLALNLGGVEEARNSLPVLRGIQSTAYGRTPRVIDASPVSTLIEKAT
jgi:deaminated glutathione amidase